MAAPSQNRRSRRAEAQRQARRAEILAAAAHLFANNGYHATSITDVIEEAGISRGTFYLYFDSKDTIFLELIEGFIQAIVRAVQVVDPQSADATAQIHDNVRRVVDVVLDNRDLTVLVLREPLGVNPDVDEKLARLYQFLGEMVEGALQNGARVGLTRQVDERMVATALIGAFKEIFLRYLVLAPTPLQSREELSRTLFDFGIKGLLLPGVEPALRR